jgi:hypothetical protein
MKNNLLLLLLFTLLLGCKKDENPDAITVNYQVGDKFTYLLEGSYFFNDTTALNKDTVSTQTDTIVMEVLKDTIINGATCLVIRYNGWIGLNNTIYVQQKAEGIFQIGELDDYNIPIAEIYPIPKLLYPNNMKVGMHWGETPDDNERRNEVIGNATVSTGAGKFDCVIIRTNSFPGEFLYNENDSYVEYISNKELVKMEFISSGWVSTGFQYWSMKMYRIK